MLGVFDSSFSFAIGKFRGRLFEDGTKNEQGFVLVFCSITLLVLTALGGFAVDVGNWYLKASKMQNAADAASLAGAPYLPGRLDLAQAAARDALAKNGFANAVEVTSTPTGGYNGGADQATYKISQDPHQPNQLHVAIGLTTQNFFVSLLGMDKENLARSSDGIFTGSTEMGSPGNVLGAEPLQSDQESAASVSNQVSANGKYWLNAAGARADKLNGDRYMAGNCSSAEKCSDGKNLEVGVGTGGVRANRYILHVPSTLAGRTVSLQAFDAAYVNLGDHCDGTSYSNDALGSPELRAFAIAHGDDADLYDRGAASQYCTGDTAQVGGGSAPKLTFTVQKADAKLRPTGGTVATKTYPGLNNTSGNAKQDLLNALNNPSFYNSFRKWNTVATFNTPGDYIVTVTTPDDSTGANRYSLRAGLGDGSGYWDVDAAYTLSLYAQHHLTVYTNAKSNQTAFYFARLTDQVAGRNITFELYDIGDVPAGQSVDLEFVKPSGVDSANWIQSCVQNGAGFTNQERVGCVIPGATSAVYNGKIVKVTMKIPDNYSCNEVNPSSCWMSLRFNLHGAPNTSAMQPSTDTTTWQINDCGAPLRLTRPSGVDAASNFGDERECPADLG